MIQWSGCNDSFPELFKDEGKKKQNGLKASPSKGVQTRALEDPYAWMTDAYPSIFKKKKKKKIKVLKDWSFKINPEAGKVGATENETKKDQESPTEEGVKNDFEHNQEVCKIEKNVNVKGKEPLVEEEW